MPTINQNTVGEFLGRFNSFNDAVLRRLEINYTQDGKRSVTVWIATQDAKETMNNGWACVRLVISQVQDFCFAEASKTCASIFSNGVHICWFSEIVGLDFSYFIDSPDDLAELQSSKFFATGSSVDWTVEAY